jgi:N-acetyl-gamma-glutamyl-phosphate reductase
MAHSVFIDGAVGTTGLEIADRLAGRGEFTLLTLDEARRKDAAARRDALNSADFAILCLPDDAAREAVALVAHHRCFQRTPHGAGLGVRLPRSVRA